MTHPQGHVDAPQPSLTSHFDRRRALLGGFVVAAVLVGAGFAVYRERRDFARALSQAGVVPVVGSLVLCALGVALTYPAWREVLAGLGVSIPLLAGARVFFVSQLGKYLPGSVWPVLLQMEAGRAYGASRRTMLAGNLITLVLSSLVGLTIAALILPFSNTHALSRYWWVLIAVPGLLVLLHPRAIPWVLDRTFAIVGRPPLGERVRVRNSVHASAWSAAAFVVTGLHVAVLVMAIHGVRFSTVLLCVGGMALAVPAGVLFIPAPAGAGVRDVILTLVLTDVLHPGAALAVVVASRAMFVIADLMLAAAASLGGTRRIRASKTAAS